MSVNDFKNIATQANIFAEAITLHLMGEPTLHSQFEKILQVCEELNINVELTTNGSNLLGCMLNYKAIKKISFSFTNEATLDFALKAGRAGKIVELKNFEAKNEEIAPSVYHRAINKFKWPEQTLHSQKESKKACLGGKTHIGILCDGTVVPCCLDSNGKMKIGNIHKTSLKEILQNKPVFPYGDLCKTCEFKK